MKADVPSLDSQSLRASKTHPREVDQAHRVVLGALVVVRELGGDGGTEEGGSDTVNRREQLP